ncbi:MAG: lipocalin-like domain-containing protein [Steroidobacteraceae bacterium]
MSLARRWLAAALLLACCAAASAQVVYPPVAPTGTLTFPRDEGSHPEYRLEWWYVTGWLDSGDKVHQPRGFQVTFFRVRTGVGEDNPSRFAPRQVLFAHAALADPDDGRLRHAQRAARAGFGLAQAATGRVDVRLDDWSLAETAPGVYRATVQGEDFSFHLDLRRTQAPLLQGDRGYSRKGPDPRAASHYYSLPQLAVSGEIARAGRSMAVTGQAWFDHEWSSDYVDERALGWDWMGINLADGGALMAFRMRDAQGGARWAAATRRSGEDARSFEPGAVEWTPIATWTSPRTGVQYPVRWRVRVGSDTYLVEPLLQDAELDSRASTGVLYWEGPVRLLDDRTGRELGRGYLELTGYGGRLDL